MTEIEVLKERHNFKKKDAIHYRDLVKKASKNIGVQKGAFGFSQIEAHKKSNPKSLAKKAYDFGPIKENEIGLEIISNLAFYRDYDKDVLTPTCWSKTISEQGSRIKFQRDHVMQVAATVGDTIEFQTRDVELSEGGYPGVYAPGLIHVAKAVKEYDPNTFEQYKRGNIQQHSITLNYLQIALAVDSDENEMGDAYKLWVEFIDKIVNKEEVIEDGFFWLVKEIKIYENSAVLFGANPMTWVLNTVEPSGDTQQRSVEPLNNTRKEQCGFYSRFNKKMYA